MDQSRPSHQEAANTAGPSVVDGAPQADNGQGMFKHEGPQAVERGPVDPAFAPTTAQRTVEAEQPQDPRGPDSRFSRGEKGIFAGVVLVGAMVAAGIVVANDGGERTTDDIAAEQAGADEACLDTWAVVHLSEEDNKVIEAGLSSLGAAETNAQARAAANEGFQLIKHDPELLADTTNVISNEADMPTAYTAEELHNGECFNREGEEAANTLQTLLARAEITPDDPLPTDINTGVNADGRLVQASEPGLTGNLDGITVVLSNGKRIGWLDRCGNFTFGTPPKLPEGPTDEKPKVTTTVPGVTTTTRPGVTSTTRPGVTTTTGQRVTTTTGPPPPTTVLKVDDGEIPGEGLPRSDDRGTPDPVGAGEGPAGQTPNESGFVPGERTVPTQPRSETPSNPVETQPTRPPATVGTTPPNTNPPVTAKPTTVTTEPQAGPRPAKP